MDMTCQVGDRVITDLGQGEIVLYNDELWVKYDAIHYNGQTYIGAFKERLNDRPIEFAPQLENTPEV